MKFCLLAAFLATFSAAYAANKECCLCDECGPVAAEKVELFTVSPFPDQPESGATCEDIAMGLLEYNEDSDMCASVHMDFHEACCTDHFGTLKIWKKDMHVERPCFSPRPCSIAYLCQSLMYPDETDIHTGEDEQETGWLQSYLRGARALWTVTSNRGGRSSRNNNRNRYSNNNRNRYGNNRNRYQSPARNGVRYNTAGGNFPCQM